MKARRKRPADFDDIEDMPAEIDFSGGIRNPFAERYRAGPVIVRIVPDSEVYGPDGRRLVPEVRRASKPRRRKTRPKTPARKP